MSGATSSQRASHWWRPVAEVLGAEAGLAVVDPLLEEPGLRRTHRVHAVRAHLLERAGRLDEARAAYAEAASLATNVPEQRYLLARSG